MIFWSKKALDNPPFQPDYSILHAISFQKMHIIWAVQFSPKKSSPKELWVYEGWKLCYLSLLMTKSLYFSLSLLNNTCNSMIFYLVFIETLKVKLMLEKLLCNWRGRFLSSIFSSVAAIYWERLFTPGELVGRDTIKRTTMCTRGSLTRGISKFFAG